MKGLNCKIGKSYKYKEQVSKRKFIHGMFGIFDPVLWLKDIFSIFNLRRLIIYALIAGSIYGYAYWRGQQGEPIYVDIDYGQEINIKLNDSYLYIDKDGAVFVKDEEGNVLKQITVKDIPALKRQLKSVSFQLVPIGVMGMGLGIDGTDFEGGGGISFLRYWKARLDAFLTNKGIYLGTSYGITDNSNVGLGFGKGYKGDNRIIIYYNWKF